MKTLLTIALLIVLIPLHAQDYADLLTKDDIRFEYKWVRANMFKRDSPYVMKVRITNKGLEQTLVRFEMLYYFNEVLHSRSGEQEYCLKPGQSITGRRWDLVFMSDIKTMEEIHDRAFSWEVDVLTIDKDSECQPGLKLNLQPRHQMEEAKKL